MLIVLARLTAAQKIVSRPAKHLPWCRCAAAAEVPVDCIGCSPGCPAGLWVAGRRVSISGAAPYTFAREELTRTTATSQRSRRCRMKVVLGSHEGMREGAEAAAPHFGAFKPVQPLAGSA
eukprot:353695-Chlamydomonas_euryale.AAC.8